MTPRYLVPLSAEEQLALGLEIPQPWAMADRVRYSEIDVLDHVNNKAYVDWFESARIAHFTHNHADAWGDVLPRTVLRNSEVQYLQEILAGESYVVTARVAAFRNSAYRLDQQIWAGGTMRARLSGVMVMLHPETREKYPLPEAVRRVMRELDGAVDETGRT